MKILHSSLKKLASLKINNLPLEITEEEVVKLLKESVMKDIESINFEMTRTAKRTQVELTLRLL